MIPILVSLGAVGLVLALVEMSSKQPWLWALYDPSGSLRNLYNPSGFWKSSAVGSMQLSSEILSVPDFTELIVQCGIQTLSQNYEIYSQWNSTQP